MSKKVEKENEEELEEKNKDSSESSAETKKSENEHLVPKDRFDEINEKYKAEVKKNKAIEKANSEAETKRLEEANEYRKLYEGSQAKIQELKPKAEKLEKVEETLGEILEKAKEEIPEKKRSLIPSELSPEAQLRWISINRSILSKEKPIDLGAGETGGSEKETETELTEVEKEFAKNLGISEKDYAANK